MDGQSIERASKHTANQEDNMLDYKMKMKMKA